MNQVFSFVAATLLLTLAGTTTFSQDTRSPNVNEILDRAEAQSKEYVETFKNLLAEETKTFVIYKSNGSEKKRKTITSTLLVIPLIREPDRVVEFRNVLTVDAKPVKDGDKRAQRLFEKLADSGTTDKEIKRLQDESLRFDEEILISGITLFQSVALESALRPYFRYEIIPPYEVNGRSVYTVSYKQMRETPQIAVNSSSAGPGQHYEIDVDKKDPLNARLAGLLTIDAATFRILGETRQLIIQPQGFPEPQVAIIDEFEFQDSDFGIMTPRSIRHTQFKAKVKDRRMLKEAEVQFVYGRFTRPDVEVQSGEVKP